jgi:hypothetical protein
MGMFLAEKRKVHHCRRHGVQEDRMSTVEIAFGEGLRMKLVTRDLRIVVSNSHGKVGELAISKGPLIGGRETRRTRIDCLGAALTR